MLKNDYLPFDQLPQAENLPFARLPRAGLWRVIIGRMVMWLILAAALLLWNHLPGSRLMRFDFIWLWLLPVLLASIAVPFLQWRYRLLAVREHDLVLQEGWWLRSMRAQPLYRVQQIQLHQSLLQRQLGLATLELYGAGKKNTRMRLPDLELKQALQLRDHALRHTASHHPVAPAVVASPAPAPATASGGSS